MIWFCIKKAFFDSWDNVLLVLCMNLGWGVLTVMPIYGGVLFIQNGANVLNILLITTGGVLIAIYNVILAYYARDIVMYQSPEFSTLRTYFRTGIKITLFRLIITILWVILIIVGIPFYANLGNIIGIIALACSFWMVVLWICMALLLLPVFTQLDRRPMKVFKKVFLLIVDNLLFFIIVGIVTIMMAVLSLVTAFLIPGPMGIYIFLQSALKLRLYKYDWLQNNPGAPRNQIPWSELLHEDQESVGKRTLKGMFFPWKE